MPAQNKSRTCALAALLSLLLSTTALQAAPPIRISDKNPMPACVSPERLMAFLRDRNENLDPRYKDIAQYYKQWGEKWRVRWDYAFYQMVIETNYLKFRRGNGRRGDVHEKQNNFAGIGATGGGVPGNRFPDVSTGVHAQIQHLVAYSGEFIDNPVAPRTELTQDGIIAQSKRLGRPVTFADLSRRWAVDRKYGRIIDEVAGYFRDGYCHGPAPLVTASVSKEAKLVRVAENLAKPMALGKSNPQKLAGPETLPWVDGVGTAQVISPEAAPTVPEKVKPAPKAKAPEKSGPPVRTIWTREKGKVAKPAEAKQELNQEAPPAPETPESPAADTPPAVDAAASPAAPSAPAAAPSAEPPSPPVTQQSAAAADEGVVELPAFKIAPTTMAEPSKLGGPVAAEVAQPAPAPQPRPAARPATMQAAVVPPAEVEPAPSVTGNCRVLTASYGGKKTLLVKSARNGGVELTALTVVDGFEQSMFKTFAKASAPGAEIVSEHASKDEAVAAANGMCGK